MLVDGAQNVVPRDNPNQLARCIKNQQRLPSHHRRIMPPDPLRQHSHLGVRRDEWRVLIHRLTHRCLRQRVFGTEQMPPLPRSAQSPPPEMKPTQSETAPERLEPRTPTSGDTHPRPHPASIYLPCHSRHSESFFPDITRRKDATRL